MPRESRRPACPSPPAKASGADLLKSLHDGSFDKAAAKIDWGMVESAYKGRRSSRSLHASV